MKKILVTGATGQLGSELTISLRNRYGAENVFAADKKPALNELTQSGPYYCLDVRDMPVLNQIVETNNIDTIFHQGYLIKNSYKTNRI